MNHEALGDAVVLPNGVEMPRLGFGTYQLTDPDACRTAVTKALGAGYRLIDTAAAYKNEAEVGRAIVQSGVRRGDLFVATKVWVQDAGYDKTMRAFETSMGKLGLDYLDLYLIHQPLGDYYGSWRALEELYHAGRVRAIGVCNFNAERLCDLYLSSEVSPMVDQVELHPLYQKPADLSAMRELGVQPEAWAPFAEGRGGILSNPALADIAKAHGKSAAQVALRWNLQVGGIVLSKSTDEEHMRQNLDVLDFALTEEEMSRIAALDEGSSLFGYNGEVASVRMRHAFKVHD